jgi:hypothetical protein
MENAAYYLEKVAQCRRLAASIADDAARDALIKLAEEFEVKAAAYVAPERAAHVIGIGDDVAGSSPALVSVN